MYQLYFDQYPLYDPREESLIIRDPDVHLAVGEAGEVSFVIGPDHPYADRLTRMKGAVKLLTDGRVIFRGRIRKDSRDFDLSREIESEGMLACLNDSYIPPFNFPDDFQDDAGYTAAAESGNVVQFFLGWLLDQHNAQVGAAQKIQLGTVTVSDPNNYISRASSDFLTTMETVRKKLEDTLGGYLVADYSSETTVLNYYSELPLTNTQEVEFGKNLLDLISELDSAETYTAILPVGKDGLTIADLPDGQITPGIQKEGLVIYSQEAEETIGGRITKKVEWKDVTLDTNLRTKAAALLTTEGVKTDHTITIKALDLGPAENIGRFTVGRLVRLNSTPHGFSLTYPLMELEPNILNPADTEITLGGRTKTASSLAHGNQNATQEKLDQAQQQLQDSINGVESSLNGRIDGIAGIDGVYFYVRYSDYSDGRNMTTAPTSTTAYMGTCSTNQATAPTDPAKYTWVKVKGADGTPGSSQYLHIRYSDDGKTFTGNMLPTNIEDWESGYYTSGKVNRAYTITSPKIQVTPGATYRIMRYAGYKLGITQYTGEDGETYQTAASYADATGESAYRYTDATYIRVYYTATDTAATFETFRAAFESGELVPYMYPAEGERGKTQGAWMGTCASDSETAPTDFDDYTWSKTVGTPGEPGKNGKTQYLHIKYSDDGETFTANNGEDLGAWIGTLVDFVEADSTNFGDYTWKKFTEDVDEELEEMRQTFTEQITSVVQNTETIIFSALERYVETSNFEEFQKTVEAELQVMADNITLRFTEATEHIENVNGDLQQTNELIAKHFEFTVDGLTIKAGEGAMNLRIDNDLISFEKNGQQFGHWDGVDFHTGNIIIDVNERAQFGNFAAVPRASGNLSWLKVRD